MNLLQLVARAHRESGLAGAPPSSVSLQTGDVARLVDWTVDAWRDMQLTPRNWRWLKAQAIGNLTIGKMSYTLNELLGTAGNRFTKWTPQSGDYRVRIIDPADSARESPLQQLPYDTFEARYLVGDHQAGDPQYWAEAPGGAIVVGPKPIRVLRLRANYQKSPQELVTDTDVPEMPAQFHMAIVWRALLSYGAYDAAPEIVSRANAAYNDIYSVLVTEQAEAITFGNTSL